MDITSTTRLVTDSLSSLLKFIIHPIPYCTGKTNGFLFWKESITQLSFHNYINLF